MSSYQEVKRNIWSNSISNYVRTVLGMVVGLLTFRMMYRQMPPEEFGFWSLLWSVFGYGILLDFGFGFAAQKRVAELSVKQDWAELSRVLSTILFFYFGVAAVGRFTSGTELDVAMYRGRSDPFDVVDLLLLKNDGRGNFVIASVTPISTHVGPMVAASFAKAACQASERCSRSAPSGPVAATP